MYFDPLSAWLVVLIADGINIAGEKLGGSSAQTEYDRKLIKQHNEWLNADIRRTKDKFGLIMPELTYENIQRKIKTTRNATVFKHTNGQIIIDLDNQEYIISLLEECSKRYSKFSSEESCQKAEWFKNAAIEARKRKVQYANNIKETLIREIEEKEKQQKMTNILIGIGLIILVAFIFFFFS